MNEIPDSPDSEDPAAPVPQRQAEPPDHALKRWEELYKYSCDSYERAHNRWAATEEKVNKYLSILGLFIGAGALAIGQVGKIAARAHAPLDWTFLGFYALAVAASVGAFGCFVWVLRFQEISAPPTRPVMVDFFTNHYYVDVIYGLGRETLAAADATRIAVDKKHKPASVGYWMMLAAAGSLLVASILFLCIQIRDDKPDQPDAAAAARTDAQRDDSEPERSRPAVRPVEGELRRSAAPTPARPESAQPLKEER